MQPNTYELKYCERCGSLRLRLSDSGGAYCAPCGQALANFALSNHAERANLLLRKPRGRTTTAAVVGHGAQATLPFAGLQ
jgi:hypothetical protein